MTGPIGDRTLNRRTVLKALGVSAAGIGGLAGNVTAQGKHGSALVQIGANTFGDTITVERASQAGRPRTAHVTTHGEQVTDYATTVVNTGGVKLGNVSSLTYDYYATAENMEAPDEVFFLLEDTDGETHTVWHHTNGGPTGEWATRHVDEEITSSGSFEWRELGVGYIGHNLIEAFSADATILRVGAGHGTTGGDGGVSDIYFSNLTINGSGRGQFPTR